MNLEAHLLAAVIAKPDDDAPRLAYADWCDGRGDPRGEFIRVQLALEGLGDDDPVRAGLAQREQELLKTYAREWAEPLRGRISEWTYRRGFIERVGTSLEASASDIVALLRLAPIRHLRDTSQFCDWDGLVGALPYLRHITGLEFWWLYYYDDEKFREILRSPFLSGLRTLILHHDRNGNLADDDILIRWLFPPADRRAYFPGMEPAPREANLRELAVNVDGTWRGPSARVVRAMARSPLLAGVRKLNLSYSRLDPVTVEEIGRSPHLARLEELDLGGCELLAESWDAILRLPQLPRLKWLRLQQTRQADSPGDRAGSLADIPRYRDAFERAARGVDWDTESITPWTGGCWKGFTWEEDAESTSDLPAEPDPIDLAASVAHPDLHARLTQNPEKIVTAADFLANIAAIEEAARSGVVPDPPLIDAALRQARGYKQETSSSVDGRTREAVVVECLLPSFGPSILPRLAEGYDPKNSWEAAGRLAAICRIDPVLGHRLCHEALPVADRYLQEVILDFLESTAPDEAETVALEMLVRGFGSLVTMPLNGYHVARSLQRLGPPSDATTSRLVGTLGHENPKVRDAAASFLKGLGPRANAAIPALHAMLRVEGEQSYDALEALKAIDPKGEADVPELVRGLDDGSYFYRFATARWLHSLGAAAHAAVPALIGALGDEHHFVRSEAADALGAIGPAARSAVPSLAAALGDRGDQPGRSAAKALARIGETEPEAFQALVDALGHADPAVRSRAVESLETSEPLLARCIPHLLAMVEEPDGRLRYVILGLLLAQPLPEEDMIAVCRAALRQENAHFDREAALALDRLGPGVRAQVLAEHWNEEHRDDRSMR